MNIESYKKAGDSELGPESLIELVSDNTESFQSFDGMLARYTNEKANFQYMLDTFRAFGDPKPETLVEFNEDLRILTKQFRDDLIDYLDSKPGSLKPKDTEKIRNLSDSLEAMYEDVKRDPLYPISDEPH